MDKQIAELVSRHDELVVQQMQLDRQLKDVKDAIDCIIKKDLPAALAQAGVSKVTTEEGLTVSVKQEVFCSISKTDLEARKEAFDWLRQQGAGELITDQVIIDNMSQEDMEAAAQRYTLQHKQDVNANSLKAFMRKGLGISSVQPQFSEEDVPTALHLYTTPVAVIKKA